MNKSESLPVWRLAAGDKRLHFEMARARTYMRHVVRSIKEHKANDADWLERADEIAGAAEILTTWMDGLRNEAAEKENKKARGE
ncbi:MAG: hypothetical protein AB7F40_11460 [Victivallaceae bacterium]